MAVLSPFDLTSELVRFATPSHRENVSITDHLESVIAALGFQTERVDFIDASGVPKANLIGRIDPPVGSSHRAGDHPGYGYFGHTDTVPVPEWFTEEFGPFEPTERDGRLYGRGSCDMKGSIACWLAAVSRIDRDRLTAPVFVTLTSDEETGFHGAKRVRDQSELFREMVHRQTPGVIGEPTRLQPVHGHKGGYVFRVTSVGRAAHSSTRDGVNANVAMIPFLSRMRELHDLTETEPEWHDPRFDPPTLSWNIGINDHTEAINITPAQSICTVYFRPMPDRSIAKLIGMARQSAEEFGLQFETLFEAPPFWVEPDSDFIREIVTLTGAEQSRTVSYGTDGAMFTELQNLVVLGPGDIAQAHTHDEYIEHEQLDQGTKLYQRLIEHFCIAR